VIFAVLVCVFAAFSPRDLWPPDEPRYGEVAREMLQTGEVLVPSLGGEPYAEKPPVWFWIAAGLSVPFGDVTPVTARLAAALLAAGAVLLAWRIARRWFDDPSIASTVALFFASSAVVLWYGPRAGLDMPLAFFVLLAVDQGSRWWETGRLGAAAAFGLAWALAVLTKGPVGFVMPPVVLAGGAWATRRPPPKKILSWMVPPLLLVGLGLLWLLPAMAAGGDAYRERLLGQLLSRASGEGEGHVRPVWYYAWRSSYLLLPWSVHLLGGLLLLLKPRSWPTRYRQGLGAAAAGGLGMLVLLSLVATKREQYLLPLVPFIAMPGAVALHDRRFPRLERVADRFAPVLLLGLAGACVVAPWVAGDRLPRAAIPACLLVALPLAWSGATALRRGRSPEALVGRVAAGFLAAAVALHVAVLPYLDRTKSYAAVARAADEAAGPGGVAYAWMGQPGNLLWNLRARPLAHLDGADALARALAPGAPRIAVVLEEKHWRRLLEEGADSDSARAKALHRARIVWRSPQGRRGLLVVTNAP
jgi:4-amino-4-deoxy-L-arabinose transferase